MTSAIRAKKAAAEMSVMIRAAARGSLSRRIWNSTREERPSQMKTASTKGIITGRSQYRAPPVAIAVRSTRQTV
jgi:hypothetical protein